MRARLDWLHRRLQALHWRWRLGLVRDGFDMRFVVREVRPTAAPHPGSTSEGAAVRDALPPMDPNQAIAARHGLRQILDQHPATRKIWPSLALTERAMAKRGGAGIERLSKVVLMDAATVLDRLMDDWTDFGVVVLRERMEQVLRTVHGCPPTPEVRRQEEPRIEIQVREGSFTDFMALDREWEEQLQAAAPVNMPEGAQSGTVR